MLLWAIKLPDKYRQNHFFFQINYRQMHGGWFDFFHKHYAELKYTVSGGNGGERTRTPFLEWKSGGGTAFPLTFHIYKTYLQLYSCFTRFLKNVHGTNIIYCAWTHLESSNSPLSQRKGMAGWTSPNGSIPELSLLTATGMLKAVGRLINTDDGGSLSNVF